MSLRFHQFLLLPAYLGRLTNKKAVVAETGVNGGGRNVGSGGGRVSSEGPAAARQRLVDMVVVYLEDFLARLRDYGVFTGTIPRGKKEGAAAAAAPVGRPDLKAMNAEREAKIRRFKAGKEREERLTASEGRSWSPCIYSCHCRSLACSLALSRSLVRFCL